MGFFGDTLCTQPARSTANTTSGPMQFPSGQQFCFLPASLQFFSDLPPRSNNSSSCLPSRSNQFSLPASTQRPLPFSFCLRAANNSLHPAQQHFLPFFVCLRAAIIFFSSSQRSLNINTTKQQLFCLTRVTSLPPAATINTTNQTNISLVMLPCPSGHCQHNQPTKTFPRISSLPPAATTNTTNQQKLLLLLFSLPPAVTTSTTN